MACGCARRMRTILRMAGYSRGDDDVWTKGDHEIPDEKIEEEHFKVLIETMEQTLWGAKRAAFSKRLGGHSGK